jgi:hypothetical protein
MEGTDKQADGGIDVEASLEMAGFRTPGQRLPQSFPPGFNKPLPEVLEEFGVAAFLGRTVPRMAILSRLTMLARRFSRIARASARGSPVAPGSGSIRMASIPARASSSLSRNLRRKLGTVVLAAAATPSMDMPA